jgi:hypothetical protein
MQYGGFIRARMWKSKDTIRDQVRILSISEHKQGLI